jgi:hypothetical protein
MPTLVIRMRNSVRHTEGMTLASGAAPFRHLPGGDGRAARSVAVFGHASRRDQLTVSKKMEPVGRLATLYALFQQEASMRKIMLTSVCAAIVSLSVMAVASAQSSPAAAPADNQTTATGAPTNDKDSMSSMNKMKKKSKMKKDTKSDSGAMEKK